MTYVFKDVPEVTANIDFEKGLHAMMLKVDEIETLIRQKGEYFSIEGVVEKVFIIFILCLPNEKVIIVIMYKFNK